MARQIRKATKKVARKKVRRAIRPAGRSQRARRQRR